jgi:hypothetical protein
LNECYETSLGNEEEITDLYNGILALDNGVSSSIDKANALASSLKLLTSEDESAVLMQLFTIYVDQQTGDESNTIDTSKVLSPECVDAFNKFSVSVDSAKAVLNGQNAECKNFDADVVDLTLCTSEPTTVLKSTSTSTQVYYNISGYLNNNGAKICNLTFYVHNLDQALEYSPEWLPFYDDRNPEGLQTGSSVEMWALVPKDAQEPTLPYLDIVNTFYVCDAPQTIPESGSDNTVPDSTTVNSPTTPTETKVNVETEANTNHISKSCFATVDCIREIASLAGDTCASYDKLLTSNCHTCNTAIVQNAKQECKDAGCSSQQCSLPLDLSSPASSLTASFCISVAAIASILVSIYIM